MIVVTGGSGFIGRKLAKELKAKIASRNNKLFIDLEKPNTLSKLKKFSIIVHSAAKIGYTWLPWFQDFNSFYKTNVKGTENLLRYTNPKYFVFLSTLAVYNSQKLEKIKPRSFYGLTKYLAERKCLEYAKKKNFKLLIIRLPMIYDVEEPKRETYFLLKFSFFLKLLKPILKKKYIRVIERKTCIKKIASLIKKRGTGTIEIRGKMISLSDFIEILNQKRASLLLKKRREH